LNEAVNLLFEKYGKPPVAREALWTLEAVYRGNFAGKIENLIEFGHLQQTLHSLVEIQ